MPEKEDSSLKRTGSFSKIEDFFKKAFEDIKNGFSNFADGIKEGFNEFSEKVLMYIHTHPNTTKAIFAVVGAVAGTFTSGIGAAGAGAALAVLEAAAEALAKRKVEEIEQREAKDPKEDKVKDGKENSLEKSQDFAQAANQQEENDDKMARITKIFLENVDEAQRDKMKEKLDKVKEVLSNSPKHPQAVPLELVKSAEQEVDHSFVHKVEVEGHAHQHSGSFVKDVEQTGHHRIKDGHFVEGIKNHDHANGRGGAAPAA